METIAARLGHNIITPPVFRPSQVPVDVEAYPIAPDGLKLEQVHVYVRHGERTPVGIRLSQPPASIPEHWIMCKTATQFQAAVLGMSRKREFIHTRKKVERVDGVVSDGECLLGELTDLGRQSTFHFGRGLRELYVERLRFLSDFLDNTAEVYFRSTNMPRTIESLQQIIHGLYPTGKYESNNCPTILIRNGRDENLSNNYTCKRLQMLQDGFAQAAATAYNPSLEKLDNKLSKYLQGKSVRVDGKPRASGIMDTVRAAIAHDIKVPPEFKDKAIVDTIERAVVSEWFAGYRTEEVRRLGMGRLLEDLTRKMQQKADLGGGDPLKILVHSTHDTALAALCATLDVFDDQWPAFTAAITFELFRKTYNESPNAQIEFSPFMETTAPEYYVRMRYQNKNMALPICAEEGNHLPGYPEFCTLMAFHKRVKELTPVDWVSECSQTGLSS